MGRMYRVVTESGTISHKLFTFENAKSEVDSSTAIVAVVTPKSHKVVYSN